MHTPTAFITAALPHLVETHAWKSTSELVALVPDLSRNTGTRILAELARQTWVIRAERDGATHWFPGPGLLDEAEAWREAVNTRITMDLGMLRLQRRLARGLTDLYPETVGPLIEPEIMPFAERGEPEHQGTALTMSVLKILARHPRWVSIHQLQLVTSAHRATLLDLVDSLKAAGWLAEHGGTFQLTPRWPSVGLGMVVLPAERAENARIQHFEEGRAEERAHTALKERSRER